MEMEQRLRAQIAAVMERRFGPDGIASKCCGCGCSARAPAAAWGGLGGGQGGDGLVGRWLATPNLRRRVAREGLVTCGNAVWGTEDVARKSQGRRQRDNCLGVNGSSRAASAPRRTAPWRQNINCAVSDWKQRSCRPRAAVIVPSMLPPERRERHGYSGSASPP